MPHDSLSTRTYSRQDLDLIDAYWRAANYLSVGQIYLMDNPDTRMVPSRAGGSTRRSLRSRVLVAGCQAAGSRLTLWPRASSLAIRRRVSLSGSRRVVK